MNTKHLRKTAALGLVLLLAALAGCRQQAQPSPELPEQPRPQPSAPAQPKEKEEKSEPPQPETETESEESFSFADLPHVLYFSSGAGGWYTSLSIEEDGSFSGQYIDSDMGDFADAYPQGTQYICAFSGQFTQPEKRNDYTYSMELSTIALSDPPGQTTIQDGTRIITSTPAGLENSETFLIYLPQAPVAQLPEGFFLWTHIYDQRETLDMYGIYNENDETAFVGF